MDVARQADSEQAALWNGIAGRAWVDTQPVLDQMYTPFEDLLVAAVADRPVHRVLDVGCGTGGTTLALARHLGVHCIGVDISQPMITLASTRAEREGASVRFICADAQAYAFEPAAFDAIVSRFGVMFFDDPVRAFANLRRAARDVAQMCLIVWRSGAENPFMITAERAAAPLLPNIPARRAEGPGQFAFADAQRVRRILQQSGWAEIEIQPIDVLCTLPETELVRHFSRMGLLGRVLHEVEPATRVRVVDQVRAAFDPFVHGAEVRFSAACWKVCAQARPGGTHATEP